MKERRRNVDFEYYASSSYLKKSSPNVTKEGPTQASIAYSASDVSSHASMNVVQSTKFTTPSGTNDIGSDSMPAVSPLSDLLAGSVRNGPLQPLQGLVVM